MSKSFDLVAIGSGAAASGVAMKCRMAGWSVAIIDSQPLGGTCAVRGCDPKKVLVSGAEAVDLAARMRSNGVAGEATINWPDLIAFKRTFTDPVPEKHEHRYAEKGIHTFHGRARFIGRNTMEVGGDLVEGRYFLIAAGAAPIKLTWRRVLEDPRGFLEPRPTATQHRSG